MKISAFVLVAVSLLGFAAAQDEQQPNPVIGPFGIVSVSENRKLNNLTLTSIHIGAGINIAQLSPVPAHYAQYYLNDTYYSDPPVGRLAYPVPGTPYVFNGGLNFNTSSNLAALWISVTQPSYGFSFNKKNELTLDGLSRWQHCTFATPYGPKQAVGWKLGVNGKPDTQDCQSIKLKKIKL